MSTEQMIRELIEKKGYTIKSFSEKIGIPYTTLRSMLEKDIGKSSVDNVIKVANGLELPVEYLHSESEQNNIVKPPSRVYKYISEPVAAGIPSTIEGMKEFSQIEIPDYLMGKWAGNKNVTIMKTNGESMNNIIKNDSYIGVLRNITLEDLHNGDMVVFNKDYEYSIKKYFDLGEYILFKPDSSCKSFKEIVVSKDDGLDIVGKVVTYNVILD